MAEVAPGVYLVEGLSGGPRAANVYLLVDEVLALVDAGLPGSLNGIARYVLSLGRDIHELRYVLITHSHPDHTGGAPALREMTGAQVLAHPADVRHTKNGDSVSYMSVFGTSSLPVPFLRRVPADGFLKEGEEIPLLGGILAYHTPGHTPGSVCFHLKKLGVLFSGDLLVENRGRPERNRAFPGSDLECYQASLAHMASLEYEVLCPGHGQPLRANASRQVRQLVKEPGSYGLSWRLFG